MNKQRLVGLYRLFFGSLTLVALIAQLGNGLQRESFVLINFFSFFTIESNIVAMLVFFITGVAAVRGGQSRQVMLRGAATLYMTMTGIIYFLLLRGLEASLQTPVPWINVVLHYIMPLAVLADWLLNPPQRRITFAKALPWVLFPVAYVIYSLVRGPFVDWYPYPFLNPVKQGYAGVAVTCAVLLVGITVLTALLALSTHRTRTSKAVL